MTVEIAKKVLEIEADTLRRLGDSIGEGFEAAVEALFATAGRVVVTGMGKSGIVGRKIAATLASTGTPSIFLHPAEALHGDLGMVMQGDVVLALSNSGETDELIRLVPLFVRLGVPVVSLTGNPSSTLATAATRHLTVSVDREACPLGVAPMASTTAQLALGDALAASLMERRGFKLEDFAKLHPGGKLGKKLMQVGELMHKGAEIPSVMGGTSMKEAIYEISSKKLGMTVVLSEGGRLEGVITDGDLRRLLEKHGGDLLSMTAVECSKKDPATIEPGLLAAEALKMMEARKITSLIACSAGGQVIGVIHLHDLWGIELF